MPPSRRKRAWFAAFLILLGLGGGLAIGAIGTALGWLRPAILESRRLAGELAEQRARPRRILAIGDSFLAWWPIEHCLNRDLQAWCESRAIGLRNAAVGGYGPLEYRERIQTLAPAFRPGLTLIFYYAGNDLTDVLSREEGRPRSLGTARAPLRALDWLVRAGALLETAAWAETPPKPAGANETDFDWRRLLDHGVDPALVEAAKGRLRHPNDVTSGYVNPYLLDTAVADPEYLNDNLLIESPRARAGWPIVRRLLAEGFVDARAQGADLCLVVIPSTVQVNSSHLDFYRRCTFHIDPRISTSTRPQDLVGELCRQAAVPLVDLLPAFRAAGSELYWSNDDHLNQAGHELVWRKLREQFLDAWDAAHPAAVEGSAP